MPVAPLGCRDSPKKLAPQKFGGLKKWSCDGIICEECVAQAIVAKKNVPAAYGGKSTKARKSIAVIACGKC